MEKILFDLKEKLDVLNLSLEIAERVREKAKLGISNAHLTKMEYIEGKLKVEFKTVDGLYINHTFNERYADEFVQSLNTPTKIMGWYGETQGKLNQILLETSNLTYKIFYGNDTTGYLSLIILGKVL